MLEPKRKQDGDKGSLDWWILRKRVIFHIPDHPKFEFVGESQSLELVESKVSLKKEDLKVIEVREWIIPIVSEFLDKFSKKYLDYY